MLNQAPAHNPLLALALPDGSVDVHSAVPVSMRDHQFSFIC